MTGGSAAPALPARILARLLDRLGPGPRSWLSTPAMLRKKKPAELVHGLDDVPPPVTIGLIAFQHVTLVRIQLIYPALVIQTAALPTALSVNMLSLALLALGIAAVLQSLPRGPVGSGFLCPSCHTGIFLEPSLAALRSAACRWSSA